MRTGSVSRGVHLNGTTLGQGMPTTTQLKSTSQHTQTLPSAAPRRVGTPTSVAEKGSRWASGDGVADGTLCLLCSLPSLLVP